MDLSTLESGSMNEKFIQEQLNSLQVESGAMKIMVQAAGESTTTNKNSLDKLHSRVDSLEKCMSDLGHAIDRKPTKADMEEVVGDVINKGASALLWKAIVTMVGIAVTAGAGWFIHGKG